MRTRLSASSGLHRQTWAFSSNLLISASSSENMRTFIILQWLLGLICTLFVQPTLGIGLLLSSCEVGSKQLHFSFEATLSLPVICRGLRFSLNPKPYLAAQQQLISNKLVCHPCCKMLPLDGCSPWIHLLV